MFDNYTAAQQKPMPKWVVAIMIGAIIAHAAGLGTFVVYGWWTIEKIALPKEGVSIAISAPPALPPAAKKGKRKKKKDSTKKRPAKRKPMDLTQTVKLDKPLEEDTSEAEEDEGDPMGSEFGDPNSTCVGIACDYSGSAGPPAPPPPPPPKPKKPKVVPQVTLEAQRIAGEKRVIPDDMTKQAIQRDGKTRIVSTIKMCLSSSGAVSKLTMLKKSGYSAYDAKIKSTMRTWRYRPFKVNGEAVPVCTSVTFIYNQRG